MVIGLVVGGCVVEFSGRERPEVVQRVLAENRVHYDLSDPLAEPLTRDGVGFDPDRQWMTIAHLGGQPYIDVTVDLPDGEWLELSVSDITFSASAMDPTKEIAPHSLDLSRTYESVDEAHRELVAFEEQFGLDTSGPRPDLAGFRSSALRRIKEYQAGESPMSYTTYVWYTPELDEDFRLGVEAAVFASTGRVGLRYMLRWPPSPAFGVDVYETTG